MKRYSLADVAVCLPYWIADGNIDGLVRTLGTVHGFYPEVQVSVCDDGSPTPAFAPGATEEFDVIVTMLPPKAAALNPCVAINAAVKNSDRAVVVLTNPGTLIHPGMLERLLAELTPNGYVAAACRDVDTGAWLCHSTFKASETLPPGAGFHFLAVLTRELWDRAGGFDEDYRQGQAYEDADFLWRLHAAGATFKILDDVVIPHQRSTTQWPDGGLERNRTLYREKRAAAC